MQATHATMKRRTPLATRLQPWLAGAGLALALLQSAGACVMNGPPVDRHHYIALAAKNPWTETPASRTLDQRDLVSLALPSGTPDDWQVELSESRQGVLRVLTEEEFSAVLQSPRALSIMLVLPGADRAALIPTPSLRIGALRPGEATLRLVPRKSKGKADVFTMNFKVEAVTPRERPPAAARSPSDGPAVTC